MSKEKQIEEMSVDLAMCHTEFATGVGEIYTDYDATAQKMFAKGYRKQSEGRWIFKGTAYGCSLCGEGVIAPIDKYCRNCGARMKGERNES